MAGTYLASVRLVQTQRYFVVFPVDPIEGSIQWLQYSHAPATRQPSVNLPLLSKLSTRMYDAKHVVTVFFQLRKDIALLLLPDTAPARIQIRLSSRPIGRGAVTKNSVDSHEQTQKSKNH